MKKILLQEGMPGLWRHACTFAPHYPVLPMLLLTLMYAWFHPFFVSVVEVNYNSQSATAETTIRCFADDLENAVTARFKGSKVNLMQTPRTALTDSLVKHYILERFALQANGRPVTLQWVGAELAEGNFWIYLEADKLAKPSSIQVTNRILYDYKKEQINLHHLTVDGKRESHKLSNPEAVFTARF